ncbi:CidA/LrgA family protein [Undibacterium sp. LX40W]|uniref:CidA/LrgA family protein n=1 Tax=Undibacterium nitidum TaxID=2762298 RepID=A0A923KKU6_9BURK|nr:MULTISPECIES: CidA/LrgA family protein [Undibacterium]MBC3881145.1 CidA/LrgA family protein [Undibacterium nitidum]MBC3890122.1 CidA/LrgA family protein [Undibacterium sp. LX40W]
MLFCFLVLLVFQFIGEAVTRLFDLPIPGPVIGMMLLFFTLIAFPRLLAKLEHAAMTMLQHLSLLFIPAGVGIMVSVSQIGDHWLAIVVSMVVSTLLTMIVTALSFAYFQQRSSDSASDQKQDTEGDNDA